MPQWLNDLHQQLNDFDMANPLTVEQRIYIAAGFDSEKIKMIRELMEEEADNFSEWAVRNGYIKSLAPKGKWIGKDDVWITPQELYNIYQQTK